VTPKTLQDVMDIVRNTNDYPSPLRPLGESSSMYNCMYNRTRSFAPKTTAIQGCHVESVSHLSNSDYVICVRVGGQPDRVHR
jgi:hypothetical protein